LGDRFRQLHLDLVIPDLNQNDFFHLTLTRQINQAAQLLPAKPPVTVIGSSLGGLTAAWLGQQYTQIHQLVLLAPALQFLTHWLPTLGQQMQQWQQQGEQQFYHASYGQYLPLSYNFVIDAQRYDEQEIQRPVPTLILHGRHDEVIPIQASRDFAAQRPWVQLVELESDHALVDVQEQIWQAILSFCQLFPE
jgi:hypothetical protein